MFTSLIDIWDSRPNLQDAFPDKGQALDDWYNRVGKDEYPGVTLVAPGDSRIQDPKTLTAEAQETQPAQALTPSQIVDSTIGSTFVIPGVGQLSEGQFVESGVDIFQVEGGKLRKVTNPEAVPSGSKFFINPNDPAFSQIPFGDDITLNIASIIDIPEDIPEVLQESLRNLIKLGETLVGTLNKTLNPDVEFTPEKLEQFLQQAKTELGPLFEQQIGFTIEDLSRELQFGVSEFQREQEGLLRQQEQVGEEISVGAAERGIAFSTTRRTAERKLGESTQRGLESAQRGTLRETGRLGRLAERQIGTERLTADLKPPSLRPLSFTGALQQPISTFTPSLTPITGTFEAERETAEQERAAQIKREASRQLTFGA